MTNTSENSESTFEKGSPTFENSESTFQKGSPAFEKRSSTFQKSSSTFQKSCGIALISFTLLLIFTMVLHPSGGSPEQLLKIAKLIVVTHAIAIFSIPFGWIGFWGLTRSLDTNNFLSMLGFAMMSVALIAVLLAASTNGLVLPIFLEKYRGANLTSFSNLKDILRYNSAVNHAFDYIYSGTFLCAIFCWSSAIIQTGKLARWTGWAGIAIVIIIATIMATGVAVNSLIGLRLFILSIVVWILVIAFQLIKLPKVSKGKTTSGLIGSRDI